MNCHECFYCHSKELHRSLHGVMTSDECHRFPPTKNSGGGSSYPNINPKHPCGEFQPKEAAAACSNCGLRCSYCGVRISSLPSPTTQLKDEDNKPGCIGGHKETEKKEKAKSDAKHIRKVAKIMASSLLDLGDISELKPDNKLTCTITDDEIDQEVQKQYKKQLPEVVCDAIVDRYIVDHIWTPQELDELKKRCVSRCS